MHRVFEREKINPWFVNLTDIQVADSVLGILRLGKGFRSNMINDKSKQMIEMIKNFEANVHKIPRSDKLQTVIDTFNDYHPRIQFTHKIKRNNKISFWTWK